METLKTSETLIEGLVKCNQDGIEGMFSDVSDLGKGKCVVENGCIDSSKIVNGFEGVDYADAPIKGISLFVELTGGVTSKSDNVGSVVTSKVEENVGQEEFAVNAGGDGVTNKSDENVGQQDFVANVGDFVWAILEKVKKQWWPGVICDVSTAPKKIARGPTREDDILVRCFGKGNYIWCPPYHIKPFIGYFEELPNQSKAKKYYDALEMALTELGYRVRTEFTCSCFSKMTEEKKTGNFGDLSVTKFEPVKFVDYIKDLARDINMPNRIDYVVRQNCLSAFYTSLGHLQIPMQQLKPSNVNSVQIKTEEGVFNEDTEKFEKSFESRGRKKSRLLSYPGECGSEESKIDVNGLGNLNQTNCQPVKILKKRGRKRKNVSPSEVLSQLHFAAKDCVLPYESKNFDSVEQFVTKFRKWVFNDFSRESPTKLPNQQIVQETGPKKVRKKKDKSVISPTIENNSSAPGSVFIDFQKVSSSNLEPQSVTHNVVDQNTFFNFGDHPVVTGPVTKLKPIKKKKNAEINACMPTWSADVSPHPPIVTGPATKLKPIKKKKNAEINAFMPTWSADVSPHPPIVTGPATKLKPIKKKKNAEINAFMPTWSADVSPHPPIVTGPATKLKPIKKKKTAEISTCMPTWNADVSPHPPIVTGPATKLKPIKKKTAENNTCMPTWSADVSPHLPVVNGYMDPFLVQGLPQNTDVGGFNQPPVFYYTNEVGSTLPFSTGNYGQTHVGPVPTGSNSNHEPKKRGRKRKYPELPNLNENGTDMKRERNKKNTETGLSCIDLSYNKVQQDSEPEVKGTAFLLKFSQDHPLPSTHDLNSIFSKYGVLIESETQVSNEKFSGQVVFRDSSNAGGAFWGLQNDQPFGPTLVNYRIQHLSDVDTKVQYKTFIKSPIPKPIDSTGKPDLNENSNEVKVTKISKTVEEIRLPSILKQPPQQGDLAGIKKNLEMMKLMLEKEGDSLLPEMRLKLEREIKGLMNKVSTIDGSSSSSYCL